MTDTPPADPALAAATLAEEAAYSVANAMIQDLSDGVETLATCDAETRDGLIGSAHVAIQAYSQWLAGKGFRTIPPGAFSSPSCKDEAVAMINAAQAYLKSLGRRGAALAGVAKPGLILPPGMKH